MKNLVVNELDGNAIKLLRIEQKLVTPHEVLALYMSV